MSLKNITKKVTDNLLNDNFRQSFLVVVLSFLLSVISAVSAIPHFMRDENPWFAIFLLAGFVISTGVFVCTIFLNKYQAIWRRVFMGAILLFFGYLCFDGGPDGFLHLWILLIPAFSFITFGIYEGFITAGPLLLVMVLFFWIPPFATEWRKYVVEQIANANASADIADFGETSLRIIDGQVATFSVNMRLRITFIYIVCLLLGFFAELIRRTVAKRLKDTTDHFEYISLHDSLTGLANQNYLARYLEEIYNNKNKYNNLGCLFVDVDGFKNVNDQYGHLFGNKVLMKIAEILGEEKNAFVCRWGGDEYVICITNTQEDRLMRIGEKYRTAISACTFEEEPNFHITVSVGAVVLKVNEEFNFNHVLELADRANRTAKNKGKDNVSLADPATLQKKPE